MNWMFCLVVFWMFCIIACAILFGVFDHDADEGVFKVTGVLERVTVHKNGGTVLIIAGDVHRFDEGYLVGVDSSWVGQVVTLRIERVRTGWFSSTERVSLSLVEGLVC